MAKSVRHRRNRVVDCAGFPAMVQSRRPATFWAALLLGAAVAWLYGLHVNDTPPPLTKGDACIVEEASQLLAAGHDRDGRRWPLFVRATDTHWLQPVPVYAVVSWSRLSRLPPAAGARLLVVAASVFNVLLLLLVT